MGLPTVNHNREKRKMRALFKIIGTLIGIVIVLFIGLAIVVPIYFDPNDYKNEIATFVQDETGRELKIEGDIGLSVFPWLAIELGALELGNAPGFADESFARLERMEIGVKVLPLLRKRLEMRAVTIHGLELNLAKNKNGRTNWEDFVQSSEDAQKGQERQKQPEEDTNEGTIPIAALGIGGLDIRDAALSWRDAQNNQYYRLKRLNIKSGEIVPESLDPKKLLFTEPVDIDISFDIEGNQPKISGHVDTSTELTADVSAGVYRLSKLKVATELVGGVSPDGRVNLELTTDAGADLAKQLFRLSALDIQTTLTDKSLPNGKLALGINTNIDVDLTKQTLQAKNFRLASGEINANGTITVNRLLKKPAFNGKLELNRFNPRTLLSELGQQAPETTDPQALTSASLSTTIQGSTNRIDLKSLSARLDQTTLNGNLGVTNFSAPAIHFNLAADAIDADRYLPPTKAKQGHYEVAREPASARRSATPGAAASEVTKLPLDTLRGLNVDGKTRIGKLTVANLHLSDIALGLKAKNGVLKAYPVKMNLYQGNYSGNIGIDARGNKARILLDEKLSGIQITPLLRDLQVEDILSGQIRLALDLDAAGTTTDGLKRTLTGNTNFELLNGVLKGIDIENTICNAAIAIADPKSALGGIGTTSGGRTEFRKLAGNLPVTNGRVRINRSLLMEAAMLRVQGMSGAIDIGRNRLNNVKIMVTPSFSCEGKGGKVLNELYDANIPVTCNGPLEGQSCIPDSKQLTNIILGVVADKQVEKLREKAKKKVQKSISEKLGDKLGDQFGEKLGDDVGRALEQGLKGIFGR